MNKQFESTQVGSLDEMRAELQAAYIPVETYNELLEQHKELQVL